MPSFKVRARTRASTGSFALSSALAAALLLPGLALAAPSAVATSRVTAELAFDEVAQNSPHVRAVWRSGQPGPTTVTGLQLRVPGVTPAERAVAFVTDYAELIGVSAGSLSVAEVRASNYGTAVKLEQQHSGRSVLGREVVVSMDHNGKVLAFTSSAVAVDAVQSARVSERGALELAQRAVPGLIVTEKATPVIVAGPEGAREALTFLAAKPDELRAFRVVVDLASAAVVGVHELTQR
jgi:Zn-dependent metalloprotease